MIVLGSTTLTNATQVGLEVLGAWSLGCRGCGLECGVEGFGAWGLVLGVWGLAFRGL